MKKSKINFICSAAMIAALYVVLVFLFQPISFGGVQCRIAESLTILPYFTSSAVPGLSIGCLIANILGGADILDIIFGTFATTLGAILSYLLRKNKWLVPLPPILANTFIIPMVLKYAYMETTPLLLLGVSIFAGEVISAGILGMVLLFALNKYKHVIFRHE